MKRVHDDRAIMGLYVGTHERTGSSILITENGAVRGGRLQRVPADQEWDWSFARRCRGLPWDFAALLESAGEPMAPASDGGLIGSGGAGSGDPGAGLPPGPMERDRGRGPPTTAPFKHVTRELINRYGPTDMCPACVEILWAPTASRSHTTHDVGRGLEMR